jgi:hypothetical protein
MTHTTQFRILEQVNPEEVFGRFREALAIPPDHPIKPWQCLYANAIGVWSWPGGFNAALTMEVCATGAPEWNDPSWYDAPPPPFFVSIELDTTYGASRELGCLQCFHMNVARTALAGITNNVAFDDEGTDDEWQGHIPPVCGRHAEMPGGQAGHSAPTQLRRN